MVGNRTKRTVGKASTPSIPQSDDRGYISCCDPFLTLASLTETDRFYNDVSLAVVKLYSEDDSATFMLIKDGEEITPLGVSVTFINEQFVAGFVIDWKQHLAANGIGCYSLRVNYDINGTEGEYIYRVYDLKHWTVESSEGMVRLLSIFNDYSRELGIDFSGSGCVDTIRFDGRFGRMMPNFEVTNHTSVGFEKRKVENESTPSYELDVFPTTSCYTDRIVYEHLLRANEIYVSDHNASNHRQSKYRDLPVIIKQGTTPEPEEIDGSNYASIKATFEDRIADKASHFNGILTTNTQVVLEMLAESGSICQPVTVTLNGDSFLTLNSGDTENVTLIDQDSNPIIPDDITGSVITIYTGGAPNPTGFRTPVNTVTDPNTQLAWYGQSATAITGTGSISKTSLSGAYDCDASVIIPTTGDFAVWFRLDSANYNFFGISFFNFNTTYTSINYSVCNIGAVYAWNFADIQGSYAVSGGISSQLCALKVIGDTVTLWFGATLLHTYTTKILLPHGYMTFDASLSSVGGITDIQVEFL